jgi:hypothetical protein
MVDLLRVERLSAEEDRFCDDQAVAADQRLVRLVLRHFGVSANIVAPQKICRHHPIGLGSFRAQAKKQPNVRLSFWPNVG